jgi:hypothetical protein
MELGRDIAGSMNNAPTAADCEASVALMKLSDHRQDATVKAARPSVTRQ